VTAASAALEGLGTDLATNNSGDCGGLCSAKDIWKPFIKTRKSNKTATDNVVRIVRELKEKIKSLSSANLSMYAIFEVLHNKYLQSRRIC